MKAQFEVIIGENKFILSEEIENQADFFKKLHFYSSLPKAAPNGSTDLVLRFRKAKTKLGKDCEYYSIVSEKEKMEYKFGQQQGVVGGLFPKGWEPLFNSGSNSENSDDQPSDDDQASVSPGQSVGLGATSVNLTNSQPKQTTVTQGLGLGSAIKSVASKVEQSAQIAAPAQTQVQNKAKSILDKFGVRE